MNPRERRLRALEAAADIEPRPPVRRVIVEIGKNLDEVLAREGIVSGDGPHLDLIVRQIVAPGDDISEVESNYQYRVKG
jgi:hypothetical protein